MRSAYYGTCAGSSEVAAVYLDLTQPQWCPSVTACWPRITFKVCSWAGCHQQDAVCLHDLQDVIDLMWPLQNAVQAYDIL